MALSKLTATLNKISTLPTTIRNQASTVKSAFDHDVNEVKDYINSTLTTEIDAAISEGSSDLETHKESADHDERYYTETELNASTDGSSGADKIGVTAIPTLSGGRVQAVLESIKTRFDDIGDTNANAELSNSHYSASGQIYDSIGARCDAIDAEFNEVNSRFTQLEAEKSDVVYVDQKVAAVASGSPKNRFTTVEALQADTDANTADGKKFIYLVLADGKWYYWDGVAWAAGGTYQSTGIADGSVLPEYTSFLTHYVSPQLINKDACLNNKLGASSGDINNMTDNTAYFLLNPIYLDFSSGNKTFKINCDAPSGFSVRYYYKDESDNYLYSGSFGYASCTKENGVTTFTVPANPGTYQTYAFRISINKFGATFNGVSTSDYATIIASLVCTEQSKWDGTFHEYNLITDTLDEDIIIPQLNSAVAEINEKTGITISNPINYRGKEIAVFKKGVAIGDSITTGTFNHNEGVTTEFYQNMDYSYPTYMTKLCDVPVSNYGLGGLTSVQWVTQYQGGRFGANAFAGLDFAIIQQGINDALQGVSTTDTQTALQYIIDQLKAANTGIKIFLATITPAYTDGVTTFDAVNTVIRNLVTANTNCYLVDLTQYSECKKNTVYVNGHLTAIGYLKQAEEYIAYISYIISQNLSAFKYVQFIGTTYSQS